MRSWASLSSLKVSVMQAEATHQSVLPFMCSLMPLQRWGNPLPQFQQSLHRLRSATSEEAGFLQMSCTAQKHPGNNFHCFRTLLSLPGGPVLSGGECKVLFPNGYIHTHAHSEQIHEVLLNLDFSRHGNADYNPSCFSLCCLLCNGFDQLTPW